jgi:hypothetical protein
MRRREFIKLLAARRRRVGHGPRTATDNADGRFLTG